jgi:hypothetical protein
MYDYISHARMVRDEYERRLKEAERERFALQVERANRKEARGIRAIAMAILNLFSI